MIIRFFSQAQSMSRFREAEVLIWRLRGSVVF